MPIIPGTLSHYLAFLLLAAIGANMIREALKKKDNKKDEGTDCSLSFKSMLLMALATSVDALAVGFTFAFLRVSIVPGRRDHRA